MFGQNAEVVARLVCNGFARQSRPTEECKMCSQSFLTISSELVLVKKNSIREEMTTDVNRELIPKPLGK